MRRIEEASRAEMCAGDSLGGRAWGKSSRGTRRLEGFLRIVEHCHKRRDQVLAAPRAPRASCRTACRGFWHIADKTGPETGRMAANGPSPARAPGRSRPGTSSQNSPITPVRIFGTRSGIGFSEQLPYRPLGPADDQQAAAVFCAGCPPTSPFHGASPSLGRSLSSSAR